MTTPSHRRRRRHRRSRTASQQTGIATPRVPRAEVALSEAQPRRSLSPIQSPVQPILSREYLRDYQYVVGEVVRILILTGLLLAGLVVAAVILR